MQILKSKGKAILDCSILLTAVVLMLMSRAGYFTMYRQGFYCDDKSISYPDLDESLKARGYVIVLILPAAAIILMVELLIVRDAPRRPFKMRIRRFVHVYVSYLISVIYGNFIVIVLKCFVGELRPIFLDVCKPDFSQLNCSAGYITEYNCTSGVSRAVLEDVYRSFPSAHAATTFMVSTFLILYLHKQLNGRPTPLTVSMLHLVFIMFAAVHSIRRISEHQHYWWDVVAGALIGIASSVYGFNFFFKQDTPLVTTTLSRKPAEDNVEDPRSINHGEFLEIDK